MKKLIYTVITLFFIAPTFAQNSTEAKSLLDRVSAKYQSNSSLYLEFESVLENKQTNTKDAFGGEVYIKGNQYNLSIPEMDIQQIYDGEKLHTIAKDQQEITISTPDPNGDELFTPTRVLDMYKNGYDLSMDETKNVNGKNITYVKLTPTTQQNIQYILVGIDKSKNELVQLIEVNNNNTTTTVSVEKQLHNIIVPSSLLKFNKSFYKDYYISEI